MEDVIPLWAGVGAAAKTPLSWSTTQSALPAVSAWLASNKYFFAVEVEPVFMVKVRLPLVPPPGEGVKTLTLAVPAVVSSVAATLAVRLLLLTKVVGSAVPFQFTTEPLMKFEPGLSLPTR